MNCRRHIALWSIVLAVSASAGEPPAPAGGLAAAKGDYEAIKEAGTPDSQQKLQTPAVPTVDFRQDDLKLLPGVTARDWLEQQKKQVQQQRRGAKADHWLLDAMRDPKAVPTQAGAASAEDTVTAGEPGLPATPALAAPPADFVTQARAIEREDERARQSERNERDLLAAKRDAVNPLTEFMAGWMSARDFELLVPQTSSGEPPIGGVSPGPVGAAPALPGGAVDALLLAPGPREPSLAAAVTPSNPYLQSVTLPAPGAAALDTPAEPVPVPVKPAPVFTPAEPAPPPTPAEQFRKTQADEKYFKQLKRF